MPSERGAALADDFGHANADAIAFARELPARTSGPCPCRVKSGRSASSSTTSRKGTDRAPAGCAAMSGGQAVTETAGDIDRANAAHAAQAGSVGPAETIALLTERGAELEALLRRLDDDQLDRAAPFGPAGGEIFAAADLAPVAARHTREHLAHARGALHRPA